MDGPEMQLDVVMICEGTDAKALGVPTLPELPAVNDARVEFDANKGRQRYLMIPGAPYQKNSPERWG